MQPRKRMLALVLLATTLGCAKHAPLRASWYYLSPDGAPQGVYLAVMNQSTTPLNLRDIRLNSNDTRGGWVFRPPKDTLQMQPGSLVLIHLDEFEDADSQPRAGRGCTLPVAVVATDDRGGPIAAEGLPAPATSLPREMQRECIQTRH